MLCHRKSRGVVAYASQMLTNSTPETSPSWAIVSRFQHPPQTAGNEANTGFSLTFEVEGHWLVSSKVPCKSEGRRPEPLGGSGGMLPRKSFRT